MKSVIALLLVLVMIIVQTPPALAAQQLHRSALQGFSSPLEVTVDQPAIAPHFQLAVIPQQSMRGGRLMPSRGSGSSAFPAAASPAAPTAPATPAPPLSPQITFKNETATPVDLYFVNLSGAEIQMGVIAAGATLTESTAASQNWRLKESATGTVIANYTATAEPNQTYTIAAPARPAPPATITTTTFTITTTPGVIQIDPNRLLTPIEPPSGLDSGQLILNDCQSSIFCNEFVEVVSCEGIYEYLIADRFHASCPDAGDGRFHAALRKFEDKVQADLRGIKTGKTSRYLKTDAAALDQSFAEEIAIAVQNRDRAFRRYDQESSSGLYPASIRQAQADLQQAQTELDSTLQMREKLKGAINGLVEALSQPAFQAQKLTYSQRAAYGTALFNALYEIIESKNRTPDEQQVYDWFANQVRKANVRQAIAKKERFQEWDYNKCNFRYWTPEKMEEFAMGTGWRWGMPTGCMNLAFIGQEDFPKDQIERYAALNIAPTVGVEMAAFAFSYATGLILAKASPANVQPVTAAVKPEVYVESIKAAYDIYETVKPVTSDIATKTSQAVVKAVLKFSPEKLKLFIQGNKIAGQAVAKVATKVTTKTALNTSRIALTAVATKIPTAVIKTAAAIGKVVGPLLIVADTIVQSVLAGIQVVENANYRDAVNNGPENARNANPDLQAMLNNPADVQYIWYLFNETVAPEPDYEGIDETTAPTQPVAPAPPAAPEVPDSGAQLPSPPRQGGGGGGFGGVRRFQNSIF